ncbi:preprotein translocase subunit YajC [Candidatus Jidaibacter acanthamoebae]|nr:preprotein translocase subunit YajC [Candidatus Jidaibacter acanthamoeba]
MSLFSVAFAADATSAATQQPSMLTSFAPLVLIMVVFYFLLIRPQQKKMKEHQGMLNKISKGDKIVTSGGIFGQVVKVEENSNYLVVEIAENVKVKIKRESVSEVINEQNALKAA